MRDDRFSRSPSRGRNRESPGRRDYYDDDFYDDDPRRDDDDEDYSRSRHGKEKLFALHLLGRKLS